MKHIALFCGIATALVVSCSVQENDFQTPDQENERFYATLEQPGVEGTRVYATEDLLLRWTADDRVSIFNKSTYNQQYKFTGETGDNAGGFRKVATDEFVTGNAISDVVSVYPYQEGTKISESEVITVTLPAEQHYAEKTFGLGANTMVSVTEDNFLQYKNVGGYLLLKLYGEDVSISSITLKGNKGEKLAGKATVTMPVGGEPSVTMSGDAATEITLTCETPVQLGSSAEESTQFWLVVPPMTFERGFTVTVTGSGGVYEKATTKTVTLERNNLFKMSPLEVKFSQPKNVIYYTSLDGSIVTPDSQFASPDAFGVNILSNEYINGQGIITFDGDVTSIGDFAFRFCLGLTSITIPDSVTSIGAYVFDGCESLTSITLPDSVTSIGQGAFRHCYSLASITIPDSVTSIGDSAFYYCDSLTSITIPDGVTSIGGDAFNGCESLTSITIPESVTSIGGSAFAYCSSLTSISIPDSVTSIGSGAFSGCSSLTSITIPESVTSIGDGVFSRCLSLMSFTGKFASMDGLFLINQGEVIAVALGKINGSITIPSNVTRIGSSSFSGCSTLHSIIIPDSVTSIGEYAFERCENLTTINIPDNLMCIEEGTFYRCSNLSHIFIPDGVTSIEKSSFSHCSSLTSIIIPESVTRIGSFAFSRCSGLTSIMIPDSVTSIGEYAFRGCSSLTSITLPDGVTTIERLLFCECSSLTSITIPESVTSIGRGAFQQCVSLSSIIVLPVIPPAGGKEMFASTNDAPIYVPASSVEEYMFTEFWIDYADRIQAIPE